VIKKTSIFFFACLILSGKLGKQSLRFHTSVTFFFGITVFLYQDENPVHHMIHWRQFCASLNSLPRKHYIFADTLDTCIGSTHEACEETEDERVSIDWELGAPVLRGLGLDRSACVARTATRLHTRVSIRSACVARTGTRTNRVEVNI